MKDVPIIGSFLLGAPKCGTSWLADVLSQHPEICISNPKEPNIVATHKGTFVRDDSSLDLSEYGDFFQGEGVKVDCSVHAFSCPTAPSRINKIWPDAKFIVSLRDPIERAVSQWNHALDYSDDKKAGVDWSEFSTAWADPRLRCDSLYGESLKNWLTFFPIDSFLIIETKVMRNFPHQVLKDICNHIGVSEYRFNLDLVKGHNLASQRRTINFLGKCIRNSAKATPRVLRERIASQLQRRGINIYKTKFLSTRTSGGRIITDSERDMAKQSLVEDQYLLEELTGLNNLIQ
jgi:hypothetical protein